MESDANSFEAANAAKARNKRESYRAKETLRKRMRKLLGKSLETMEAKLDDALEAIEEGAESPIPLKELVAVAEILARYGVGTEDTKEVTQDVTKRYVVKLPQRKATPIRAVATIDSAALLPSGDYESHPEPGIDP